MNEKRDLSGILAIWVVICFTVIALFCATLFKNIQNGTYFAELLIYVIGVVGAVVLFKYKGVNYIKQSALCKKINFQSTIYVIAMGLGLVYFGSFFANTIYYGLELVGYKFTASDVSVTNITELLVNLVIVCLVPAFCEEFLIRGGVFQSMNKSQNCLKSILLSALFFAILHGSIVQTVHQFLMGISCAVILIVSKSLWYPIILHIFNNSFALIVTYLQNLSGQNEVLTATEFFTLQTFAWQVLFAIIGLGVAYFAFRAFLRKEERKVSEEYADSVMQSSLLKRVVFFDQEKKENQDFSQKVCYWGAVVVCVAFVVLDLIGGMAI